MNLDNYLDKWSLSSPQKIADSATSSVYRVEFGGRPAVLKLLTDIGVKDESLGAKALEYFRGHGAVRIYRADERAHLLEYVEGENLRQSMRATGDKMATRELISVLRKLQSHRQVSAPEGLTTLERRFRYLFETAAAPGASAEVKSAAAVARELLSSQERVAVLHGDLHHENILLSQDRGWIAIDPKGLAGDPAFDVANTFFNPMEFFAEIASKTRIEWLARAYADELGFDYERILGFAFIYGHLSVAWMKEEGLPTERVLQLAGLIGEMI